MTVKFRTAAEMTGEPVHELINEREAVFARMTYLMRDSDGGAGGMRASVAREYDALEAVFDGLTKEIDARSTIDRTGVVAPSAPKTTGAPGGWVRDGDGLPAALAPGARFAEHPVVTRASAQRAERDEALIGAHGGLGQQIRAAISTSSGAAIVPTRWAGDIIDRARNLSAVLRAGAQIVPMDAKTVQIGRVAGDPTAAFRAEASAITATDPTLDSVTLDAKTMSCLVVASLEWFQDAENADTVVRDAIAGAMATQLDLVALFGGVIAGGEGFNLATPPNPRGILASLLANAPTSVLGSAANGTAQTAGQAWNEIIDTVFTPRDYNETPNALIWNSKMARQMAKTYDTTGQPLAMPADVTALQRFVSNQIPSFTQGTMTSRATDVFAGDFAQLLIGQRLDITIQVLAERYADTGQVGLVAHWRGDVQLARPRAFSVYRYLQGA